MSSFGRLALALRCWEPLRPLVSSMDIRSKGSVLHAASAEQRAPSGNGERRWVSGWREVGEVHGEAEVASHMFKLTHKMWVEKRRCVKDAPQGEATEENYGSSRRETLPVWGQVEDVSGQPEGTRVIECGSLQTWQLPNPAEGWRESPALLCFPLNWKRLVFLPSSLRFFHMSFLAFLKEECHKENMQICPDVIKYFPKKAKLFLSITLVCRLP